MRPLFWLSSIVQESQRQSASRGRVLAFYRIAPCLSSWKVACVADETKPRYTPVQSICESATKSLFRVTRIFYNRFLLALAYGCSFVNRDWIPDTQNKHALKTPLLINLNFFPNFFFSKIKFPNPGHSLSASAACTPVFTVVTKLGLKHFVNCELYLVRILSFICMSQNRWKLCYT